MSQIGAIDKVRVGVSSCLLGEQVRWDGASKRHSWLVEVLGRFVEWVPVCPEVEIGLGVPRDALHLERQGSLTRLVATATGADLSERMRSFAETRVASLLKAGLSGYVFKKGSPSCGTGQVPVRGATDRRDSAGRGVFAAMFLDRVHRDPVEEEDGLEDPRRRENFVERVFACHRLARLLRGAPGLADLVAFHAAHEWQLRAHSATAFRELGRLPANARRIAEPGVFRSYAAMFMDTLSRPATTSRHAEVLEGMAGRLELDFDAETRAELAGAIVAFRQGAVPRHVPLDLVRRLVARCGSRELRLQTYLDPFPAELHA